MAAEEEVWEDVSRRAAAVAKAVQEIVQHEWRTLGRVTYVYCLSSLCTRIVGPELGPEEQEIARECLEGYMVPLLSLLIHRTIPIDEIAESYGFRDLTPSDLTPKVRKSLARYLFWKEDIDDGRILEDERVAFDYIAEKLTTPRVDYFDMKSWLGAYTDPKSGFIVIFKLFYNAVKDDVKVRYRILP